MARLLTGVMWGLVGAAIVFSFMIFLDEMELGTILVAGASFGLLRVLFPDDALSHLPRRVWLGVVVYVLVLYAWQLVTVWAGFAGDERFANLTSIIAQALFSFPSSLVAYFAGRYVGGDLSEFLFFAVPAVNGMLVALALGMVWRKRVHAREHPGPPATGA